MLWIAGTIYRVLVWRGLKQFLYGSPKDFLSNSTEKLSGTFLVNSHGAILGKPFQTLWESDMGRPLLNFKGFYRNQSGALLVNFQREPSGSPFKIYRQVVQDALGQLQYGNLTGFPSYSIESDLGRILVNSQIETSNELLSKSIGNWTGGHIDNFLMET